MLSSPLFALAVFMSVFVLYGMFVAYLENPLHQQRHPDVTNYGSLQSQPRFHMPFEVKGKANIQAVVLKNKPFIREDLNVLAVAINVVKD